MKFRKKPVVIEAFQMTRERRTDNSDWPEWLHRAWNEEPGTPGWVGPAVLGTSEGVLEIATPEGKLLISWNDWIIKGVKGELYPCKPDVFEATYDAAQINDMFDGMTAAQVDAAQLEEATAAVVKHWPAARERLVLGVLDRDGPGAQNGGSVRPEPTAHRSSTMPSPGAVAVMGAAVLAGASTPVSQWE